MTALHAAQPRTGDTPEVSVVVSTYRRSALLPRLVAALEAQTLPPERFEVLIVDNGSGDDTWDVLTSLAASSPLRLRPLRIDDNHGPAPARNLGWRSAVAPYVAFTDDDCVPRPDWLEQSLASARATPDLGVLQGATVRPSGPYPYGPNTVYRETLTPSPYFEGCNLLFPRAVLERTGGFDEAYHFGGEDTAAGWAAIEDGGRWLFDETSVVAHDIVERPLRWHLMMAWREGNLVDVAVRHPELRRQGFWRPWAHRPWNVAVVAGLAGTLLALWGCADRGGAGRGAAGTAALRTWSPRLSARLVRGCADRGGAGRGAAGTAALRTWSPRLSARLVRRPGALLAWLPWLVLRRPPVQAGPRVAASATARWLLNDVVVAAGMARASIRNRTVVL